MGLLFDKINKVITVEDTADEITIQNLLNAIRQWEDELSSMDIGPVASAAGKEPLGAGVTVGITLTLLNNWRLAFEARSGPTYIQCKVSGGNLVGTHLYGVIYPTAFTQVVLTASSSATLQELSAIQYSSFNNAVTVDVVNGVVGTVYNIGTLENPVNNIADALIIAAERGFELFHIHGDLTLGAGDVVAGFGFEGYSPDKTTIIIGDATETLGCEFKECTVTGTLDGDVVLEQCVVATLSYVNGEIRKSNLVGPITLGGGANALFKDCCSSSPTVPPVIDMGGSGQNCIFHDYSGAIHFKNMTGVNYLGGQLDGGKIILDFTITSGTVMVVGVGLLIDSTGAPILSGIWNGGVTVKNFLVNTSTVAYAVWNEPASKYVANGVYGKLLNDIESNTIRSLGLAQENYYLDQTNYTTYQGIKLLTSGRLRIYSLSGSVGTDSDVIATYNIVSAWSGDELNTYKVTKV